MTVNVLIAVYISPRGFNTLSVNKTNGRQNSKVMLSIILHEIYGDVHYVYMYVCLKLLHAAKAQVKV